MTDMIRPILQLSVFLPGILLAYLPVKQHLKIRPARLAAIAIPLVIFFCLAAGYLCFFFRIRISWIVAPAVILFGIFYMRTLNLSRWIPVSVILAICASFTCLGNMANGIHQILYPGNCDPWLSLKAVVVFVLACWISVFLAWHPATHAARSLVNDPSFARTWYVFWILPIMFIGLNAFMFPFDPEVLQCGRILILYISFSLIFLVLLLLFYALFYVLASGLNKNNHLKQENMFLSMQQAQYDNLRTAIMETREARHDMHHHLNALQALAEQEEWEALTEYLCEAKSSIPNTTLNLCENAAIDAVASHYAMLYRKNEFPFSMELDLPAQLPVSETDCCLVLSNLLENALEASLLTDPAKQHIQIQARLYSSHIILLTVQNAFNGKIREKDGIFLSSKRSGYGVGLQSVRRIAEKNGGSCQFTYNDETFCANIMLR